MTHFQLRIRDDHPHDIELWLSLIPEGKRASQWQLAHIYTPQEQYPLGSQRYALNRANLFVDVLSVIESNATLEHAPSLEEIFGLLPPLQSQTHKQEKDEHSYSTVSLKALAQKAMRVAADGSGNARRFKDARSLWMKIEKHVSQVLTSSLHESIEDVRKSHNWKKNQPYKTVSIRPDSWFVLNVFSRSNPRKDPFIAVRSLSALWEYLGEHSHDDDKVLAVVEKQQNAVNLNADYPTYGEIAALVEDSNMLVFPDDQLFIDWIRRSAGSTDEVSRDTLVEAHVIPNAALDSDDPAYVPAASMGTVLHLANVLEQADRA